MAQAQCGQLRVDFAKCIVSSDMFQQHPLKDTEPAVAMQDCLKRIDELPVQCQFQRKALFECKRALLDMRKRFRGIPSSNKTTSPSSLTNNDAALGQV